MPEGQLGFDRRFADSVLMYRVRPGKRVPVAKDEQFTKKFLSLINKDRFFDNREYEIKIRKEDLGDEEKFSTALGMAVDEQGIIEVQLTDPPELTKSELKNLKDAIGDAILDTFKALNIDHQLTNTGGDLVAIVNGPLGGPRPFVDGEIVVEGLYDTDFDEVMNQKELIETAVNTEEFLFKEGSIDKRVDVRIKSNRVVVVVRDSEISSSDINMIWGTLRDIHTASPVDISAELTTTTYISDGVEV